MATKKIAINIQQSKKICRIAIEIYSRFIIIKPLNRRNIQSFFLFKQSLFLTNSRIKNRFQTPMAWFL